jgi:PAS domain S-box-containing protein
MSRFRFNPFNGMVSRYALAVVVAGAGILLRYALTALVGEGLPTYIVFYPPVMVAALLAGLGPGLLATGLAAIWAAYWLLPPAGLAVENLRDAVGLVLFLGMGVFMSTVAELYRRTRSKAAEYDKEQALRETRLQKEFLAGILERASQPFAVGYPDGRLGLMNQAFEQLTGYRAEELRSPNCSGTLTPPELHDVDRLKLEELRLTGQPVRYETELMRKDGTRVYVERLVHLVNDPAGNPEYYYSFFTDITERKKTEAALRKSEAALQLVNTQLQAVNEQLRLSNETLEQRVAARTAELERRMAQLRALAGQLTRVEAQERWRLAAVLHDGLQQLLVGARIRLEILRSHSKGCAPSDDLQGVLDLLAESLSVSRSLTVELCPPALNQAGLADALQWLGRWFAEKQGLAVHIRADPAVRVEGEEMRIALFQAVRELLFNVVKHAGVKEASVTLDRDDAGAVRITTWDTGAGFHPAEVRAREGTTGGFGLFSLRERLELLGATLTVESSPGQGSRFTILAPLQSRQTQPTPKIVFPPKA